MKRPSPALIVAVIALLVALSPIAQAARVIVTSSAQIANGIITGADVRNESLTGADVRDGSITGADIRNGTVRSADVGDGSLRAEDFAAGQLPAGATGPQGPAGAQGPVGAPGEPGAPGTDGVDGTDGADGVGITSPLPSGTTVTGVIGGGDWVTVAPGVDGEAHAVFFSFPFQVTSLDGVNFPEGLTDYGPAHPDCSGTYNAPTAPAGRVCVYPDLDPSPSPGRETMNAGGAFLTPAGNGRGFEVEWYAGQLGKTRFVATWAYTAP